MDEVEVIETVLPEGQRYESTYEYTDLENRVIRYQNEGLSLSEAFERAIQDIETETLAIPLPDIRPKDDYMGASTASLMDTKKKVKKGGSKVKRMGSKKKTFGNKYQTIEDEPRIFMAVGRVSESTSRALNDIYNKFEVNVAGLLAAIALIHDDGNIDGEILINTLIVRAPKIKTVQIDENLV